jgi:hypothetical protein
MEEWIASSLPLLAMTKNKGKGEDNDTNDSGDFRRFDLDRAFGAAGFGG